MKRKSTRDHRNSHGRYFGSVEPITAVPERLHLRKDGDIFCQEGKFSDFISLDISDEETGEDIVPAPVEQITMCDNNPTNVQVTDLDELIQPIRIMYKNPAPKYSPAVESVLEGSGSGSGSGSYISEDLRSCEVRI